jgi:hypothetical protein
MPPIVTVTGSTVLAGDSSEIAPVTLAGLVWPQPVAKKVITVPGAAGFDVEFTDPS